MNIGVFNIITKSQSAKFITNTLDGVRSGFDLYQKLFTVCNNDLLMIHSMGLNQLNRLHTW